MDPNKKVEEEILPPQEMITRTADEKCCVDCKTTKTPLWRSGPAGPKSLCNACGIRHRKKRSATGTSPATSTATVGLDKEEEKIKKEKHEETIVKKKRRANIRDGKCGKLSVGWRQRFRAFGQGVVLYQRQRSPVLRKRQSIHHRKLGEVEQAAVLLMALSCGSVFA
ncbi:GATA transcription factor 15-like [Coffea arabica]|uniref:GATA transcription factor 15-like n=1 Tax=Coffea arabica TaxID=13443 RepID=A0A6P6VHS3_COFAR|nr:GATA transcription factor 16-like [Coffea arabica]